MLKTKRTTGFTMIELVVVMAMIGLLLSIALPQYMSALDRGREQVLQHNLATMREAIDKFYGDRGKYPDSLEDLVTYRYLREIPKDPFSESATWVVVAPKDPSRGGLIDVQSTFTDANGQPRRKPGADTADPASTAPASTFVAQEGGATTVVTVGPAATDAASTLPAATLPAEAASGAAQ